MKAPTLPHIPTRFHRPALLLLSSSLALGLPVHAANHPLPALGCLLAGAACLLYLLFGLPE